MGRLVNIEQVALCELAGVHQVIHNYPSSIAPLHFWLKGLMLLW